MDKWTEKAFDFALDTTKQFLALAAGIVALTVTFLTDVAPEASEGARRVLAASWVAFLLSIVFGMLTMMALTGLLGRPGTAGSDPKAADDAATPIYSTGVRLLAGGQGLMFFAGTLLTVVFGVLAM